MRKTLLALVVAASSFILSFAVTAAVLTSVKGTEVHAQVAPKPRTVWMIVVDVYVADKKADSLVYKQQSFHSQDECEHFADHSEQFLKDLQGLYESFVKANTGKDVELKDLECVEVPAPSIGI